MDYFLKYKQLYNLREEERRWEKKKKGCPTTLWLSWSNKKYLKFRASGVMHVDTCLPRMTLSLG